MISQLRCGILPLHMETGRLVNLKCENRICEICGDGSVEDELHFIFHCSAYNNHRTKIEIFYSHLSNHSYCDKLKYLIQNHPQQLAKYVCTIYHVRKNKLYN